VNACVNYIRNQQDLELLLTPDLGSFSMRLVPPGFPKAKLNALQKYLYQKAVGERERSVSMTHVNGKIALRFLILTPEQDPNKIINTFHYLRRLALQFEN
jgi:glutamate/tyrosine decarboxylase-like PLP-dependent enzyme